MDRLLAQYESLAEDSRWLEALPVIRKIIDRHSGVDTSWFNYGVCLDELKRHDEAAEAFIKAQELNIEDWGIHYRILRSFCLANDFSQFTEFADYSCGLNSEMLQAIMGESDFSSFVEREEFKVIRLKYGGDTIRP